MKRHGAPEGREAAWLLGAGGDVLAFVRLVERIDAPGAWDLDLYDPATGPGRHAHFADERQAREAFAGLYAAGEGVGRWRIRRPGYAATTNERQSK